MICFENSTSAESPIAEKTVDSSKKTFNARSENKELFKAVRQHVLELQKDMNTLSNEDQNTYKKFDRMYKEKVQKPMRELELNLEKYSNERKEFQDAAKVIIEGIKNLALKRRSKKLGTSKSAPEGYENITPQQRIENIAGKDGINISKQLEKYGLPSLSNYHANISENKALWIVGDSAASVEVDGSSPYPLIRYTGTDGKEIQLTTVDGVIAAMQNDIDKGNISGTPALSQTDYEQMATRAPNIKIQAMYEEMLLHRMMSGAERTNALAQEPYATSVRALNKAIQAMVEYPPQDMKIDGLNKMKVILAATEKEIFEAEKAGEIQKLTATRVNLERSNDNSPESLKRVITGIESELDYIDSNIIIVTNGHRTPEEVATLRALGASYVKRYNTLVQIAGTSENAKLEEVHGKLNELYREINERSRMVITGETSMMENAENGRKNSGWFGKLNRFVTLSDPYEIDIRNAKQKINTMEYVRKLQLPIIDAELAKKSQDMDIPKVIDAMNSFRNVVSTLSKVNLDSDRWKQEQEALKVTRDVAITVMTLPTAFVGGAASASIQGVGRLAAIKAAAQAGARIGARVAFTESTVRNTDEVVSGSKTFGEAAYDTTKDTAKGAATGAVVGVAADRVVAGFSRLRSTRPAGSGATSESSGAGPKAQPEAGTAPNTGPRAKHQPKPPPHPKEGPRAKAESGHQAQPETQKPPNSGPRTGPRSEPPPNPNGAKSGPKPGPQPQPETGQRSGPKNGQRQGRQPEPPPNANAGPKNGPKHGPQPNQNTGPKSGPKADAKPEGSSNTGPNQKSANSEPKKPNESPRPGRFDYKSQAVSKGMTVEEFLGLGKDATFEQVITAAKKAAREMHPDMLGGKVTPIQKENGNIAIHLRSLVNKKGNGTRFSPKSTIEAVLRMAA